MKKTLLLIFSVAAFMVNAQNLLTQNPSFETYSGATPTDWSVSDNSALMVIVTDASDGSVGLKVKKDPTYTAFINFRIVNSQLFNNLIEQPLSLKFDYKVVSGEIDAIGLSMRPDTFEFANCSTVSDGEWHYNNIAFMGTSYIGAGWASDYLNVQFYHAQGQPNSEVIIDNLAFGYVGTLGNENFQNAISQDITIGPNPTNSMITFFNVDKIENKKVIIYDLNGKIILQTELSNDTLDLSSLKTGIYTMHLGNTVVKKIIKK